MRPLLSSRRFLPYFVTQGLGALNDNLYRFALMFTLTFVAARDLDFNIDVIMNLAAGLFILPYLLFSGLAGQLADRYDKAKMAQVLKATELLLMLLAAAGFLLKAWLFLLVLVFLMGAQSAMFGPLKYAILPQHLERGDLMRGNGWVAMATFLAILFGTLGGGLLNALDETIRYWVISGAVIAVALIGLVASLLIPPAPATQRIQPWVLNPFRQTWKILKGARRGVVPVMLAIGWFWFVGSGYLTQFPNFTREVLGGNEGVGTLLLALFAIGIGTGALLIGYISRGKIRPEIAPLSALAIAVISIGWYLLATDFTPAETPSILDFIGQPGAWGIMLCIALTGVAGGIYIVPLYSFLQRTTPAPTRAQIIGALNVINALFMVGSAVLGMLLFGVIGTNLPTFFLLFGLSGLLVTAVAWLISAHRRR